GRHPFRAKTVPQILKMVVQEQPPRIEGLRPDVDQDLANLIRTMMAKNPDERFQTPNELAVVLDRIAAKPEMARRS
ncbi:hypothetical protein ACFL59_13960, partial [Planctomycetota bacterium]